MPAFPFFANAIAVGGGPASGARLQSYVKSTTTPLPVWLDSDLSVPATNPAIADADGRFEIYADSTKNYTWQIRSADSATVLWEADITGGVLVVTYVNGILIESSWATALATPLGTGVADTFAIPADNAYDVRAAGVLFDDNPATAAANVTRLTDALNAYAHTKLPAGTMYQGTAITCESAPEGRIIRGAGMYQTVIKRVAGTDTSFQFATTQSGVEVQDMCFEGSYDPPTYAPASTNGAILFNNANETVAPLKGGAVRRVRFINQQAGGITLTGGNQGMIGQVLDDIYSSNCPRYGAVNIFKGITGLRCGSIVAEDGGVGFGSDDGTQSDDIVYPSVISQTNPMIITAAAHGVLNVTGLNKYLKFFGIGGMTQLNGLAGKLTVLDANTIQIDIDATGFSAFTSGGYGTTLRANTDIRIESLILRRLGRSTVGEGEAANGHSGAQNWYFGEVIIDDNGFDILDDLTSFAANRYGTLFNSGQDGINRSINLHFGKLVDRRNANVSLALFGVKNLHIHEYICEDAWLRQSDPGGVCPAIRLSDDAGNSPCDGIYIYGGRLAKNNAFSRVNCLIENQSTDARNIYVNWRNFELPSGVAGYVENGQTTNTQDV